MITAPAGPVTSASLSPRQGRIVLAACTVAAAFDGFDGQVVAFLAPGLARAWHLPVSAFGLVFSLGLLGLMIGGLVLAPLADRYGRRTLLVAGSCVIAITMIGAASAHSVVQLTAWRLLTGLGLGAMMPALVTVAHECAPPRQRALYVTILVSGFPAGGFLGGLLVAWGATRFSWQALFIGMGMFALAMAWALAQAVRREPVAVSYESTQSRANPAALFREARAIPTLLTWLLFLATLANVYFLASWLPSLLERDGFSPRLAVLAAAVSNLGGVAGGLALGWLLGRLGGRVLASAYAVAALALAGLGFIAGAPATMFALSFAAGFLIPGGHVCNNAVAASRYPTTLRATGVGWAQSVGRMSTVIGPAAVALALQHFMPNRTIFLVAAGVMTVAALAAFALIRYPSTEADA